MSLELLVRHVNCFSSSIIRGLISPVDPAMKNGGVYAIHEHLRVLRGHYDTTIYQYINNQNIYVLRQRKNGH